MIDKDLCPKCKEFHYRVVLSDGRLNRKVCRDDVGCGWWSAPYAPKKRPVRTVTTTPRSGMWTYETFDQYGQTVVYSEGFGSKAACIKAARQSVQDHIGDRGFKTCVAVVWPPVGVVRGTLVKPRAPKGV